jgi:hypothetical protein
MAGDSDSGVSPNGIYHYKPSEIGAIIFAGLFGISTILHILQMIRGRAWFYTSFVIGSISMSLLPSLPLFYLRLISSFSTLTILRHANIPQ